MSKRFILFLLPLIIFLGLWAILYRVPLSLFELPDLHMATFADKDQDNGQSEILKFEEGKGFKAVYFELRNEFISPYAGMSLFQEATYWDLSEFNEVEIEVELQNTKNLELTLATYQNGLTKENEPITFRHNVMEIPIQDKITLCKLPLDKVQTAQWWLEKFKLRSTELGPVDWKKTSSISFVAKIRLDTTKPQLLKINSITFKRDLSRFYVFSIVLLILYYGGFIYYLRVRRVDTTAKGSPESVLDRAAEIDEKEKVFLEYVADHYCDPELTLGKMSESLKVSEKSISGAIKKHTNMSFKEYLNDIRLTEAKKLLNTEGKQVSEIAYAVGFSSPNHFNRTFKNQEGCTPTEFRNQKV